MINSLLKMLLSYLPRLSIVKCTVGLVLQLLLIVKFYLMSVAFNCCSLNPGSRDVTDYEGANVD